MYVVYDPSIELSARSRQVVEICQSGGCVRYQLERSYFGGEKFQIRVYDSAGNVVRGLGYKAAYAAIASGALVRKEVPATSAYVSMWAI